MAQCKLAQLVLLAAALCVTGAYAHNKKCEPIPAWGQCGGSGGSCGHKHEHKCGDHAYPGCECVEDYECTKKDDWFWQCTPKHKPAPSPTPKPCAIPMYGQCGGKGGNCKDWKQCPDKSYEGCMCAAGSTCQKKDEYYYQCRPSTTPTPPPKCTIPEWGECMPHHHMHVESMMSQGKYGGKSGSHGGDDCGKQGHKCDGGDATPHHKGSMMGEDKHGGKGGHGGDDCGKPGHKCGDGDGDSHHCTCVWGTNCMKLDHEHVWKCAPKQKPTPSPGTSPPAKVCPPSCKVKAMYGEDVSGVCSGTATLAGDDGGVINAPCPVGYTSTAEKCDHGRHECGVCCIKKATPSPSSSSSPPPKIPRPSPSPSPSSSPSPPPKCPTTCQVGFLGKLGATGYCSSSLAGGSATYCPHGYFHSGHRCDAGGEDCGLCCISLAPHKKGDK